MFSGSGHARGGACHGRIDTDIDFLSNKVYDAYIFCAPSGNAISWRIDNVSDGLKASGETSEFLPNPVVLMRAGAQLQTINAVVRNIRIQPLYIESDR